MKKLLWYSKVAVLCVAMFVLSGGYASGVTAQDEGMVVEGGVCYSGATCSQSTSNQCFCADSQLTRGCTGCFIPNGGSGCGTCR
jgi:hypothetical protein